MIEDLLKGLQQQIDLIRKDRDAERARKGEAIRKLKSATGILEALGYYCAMGDSSWSHRSMRDCPGCGGRPILQTYNFDDGGWIAICSDCSHRTEAQKTPNRAVKAWNAGEFTYLSKMTQNRLDGSPRGRRKRHDEDDT